MAFVKEKNISREKYTSQEIKANVIAYLRFKRKLRAFTEYTHYRGDIEDIVGFSSDLKEIWCIEVKCSKQDFLQDFKTKEKWEIFEIGKKRDNVFSHLFFTKMFFAVPQHLESFVIEYLNDKYPQIGVIIPIGKTKGYARISKSAKLLSPYSVRTESERLKLQERFMDRISSELAQCYEKMILK